MRALQPDTTHDAFYGTSQIEAAAILEGRFLPRHGEEQYLGTGIYFFVGNADDAVRWAKQRSPYEWAVLRCAVRYGRCLDLHSRTGSELLATFANDLSAARGERVKEGDAVKLLARFTAIDTVRAVHRRPGGKDRGFGKRAAESAAAIARLQTILCVRNLASIQRVETHRIGN